MAFNFWMKNKFLFKFLLFHFWHCRKTTIETEKYILPLIVVYGWNNELRELWKSEHLWSDYVLIQIQTLECLLKTQLTISAFNIAGEIDVMRVPFRNLCSLFMLSIHESALTPFEVSNSYFPSTRKTSPTGNISRVSLLLSKLSKVSISISSQIFEHLCLFFIAQLSTATDFA